MLKKGAEEHNYLESVSSTLVSMFQVCRKNLLKRLKVYNDLLKVHQDFLKGVEVHAQGLAEGLNSRFHISCRRQVSGEGVGGAQGVAEEGFESPPRLAKGLGSAPRLAEEPEGPCTMVYRRAQF